MKTKRHLLFLLLILLATCVQSQQIYSTNPDSATLFPTVHGSFENYAFILNGKVIKQHELIDFPGAKLNNVFPYAIKFEGHDYAGAVYFHTQERYAPPIRYANDPAYFVNGKQVSPYHFRLTKVEAYNQIRKSEQDTMINGTLYRGSIQVDTDEDFLTDRLALPELIRKYTGLPPERVIVHWRGSIYRYMNEDDIGTILSDHFPIYYFKINPSDTVPGVLDRIRFDVRAVEVDRIRFAEGERYVVHLVDINYKRSTSKGRLIFEDPLAVDTVFPCYVTDFDPGGHGIFTSTEISPNPYHGEAAYLKKLSIAMGLPVSQQTGSTILDSITVRFVVLRDGMLADLERADPDKSGQENILQAIKRLACVWSPAIQGGRPVIARRKMTIYYSKDPSGRILSLNSLIIPPIKTR